MKIVVAIGCFIIIVCAFCIGDFFLMDRSHVMVTNHSGGDLARCVVRRGEDGMIDVGPLRNGATAAGHFWFGSTNGELTFEITASRGTLEGSGGQFIDGEVGHQWTITLLPNDQYSVTSDRAEPISGHLSMRR